MDLRRLAGLAAAIMIGFQLGANHWSYTYLAWIVPCIIVALLADEGGERREAAQTAG
jgi:hypothetical protein